MPRAQTSAWHCSWCHVVEITAKAHPACPLCGGPLLAGAPHEGTYAPMSADEKHAVFSKMMSDNHGIADS